MPVPSEEHQLLSGFEFFLVCLVVVGCYYCALICSAKAVGDSTRTLVQPLQFVASVWGGVVGRLTGRRQGEAIIITDEGNTFDNDPAPGLH